MNQEWLFPEEELTQLSAEEKETSEPGVIETPVVSKPRRKAEKMESLFCKEELKQPPLSQEEKERRIRRIVDNAKLGAQYMYSAKEVCEILRITYDEIQTLLDFYKLDCVIIRDTIVRIPWWSLAEYLIDPADDVETAMYAYLKSLPHGRLKNKKSA